MAAKATGIVGNNAAGENMQSSDELEMGKLRAELKESRELAQLLGRTAERWEARVNELERENGNLIKALESMGSLQNEGGVSGKVLASLLARLEEAQVQQAHGERKLALSTDNARILEKENRRMREELDAMREDRQAEAEKLQNLQAEFSSLQQTLISTKKQLAEKDAPFGDRVQRHLANRRGLRRFFYFPAAIGKAFSAPKNMPEAWEADLQTLVKKGEFAAAEQFVRSIAVSAEYLAAGLQTIAIAARRKEPGLALRLLQEAAGLDPAPKRTALQAFQQFYMGNISAAHALMAQLGDRSSLSSAQLRTGVKIAVMKQYMTQQPSLPDAPAKKPYQPRNRSILFVGDKFPSPYGGGAGSRLWGLMKSLAGTGVNIAIAARGTPSEELSKVYSCEVIEPDPNPVVRVWFEKNAAQIARKATKFRAAAIHCAASSELAISALMAAKRLGIPFVYDIYGFEEFDFPENVPNYSRSELFKVLSRFKIFLASNADLVITWRPAMADRLISRGIDPARIHCLPQNIHAPECPWPLDHRSAKFVIVHPGVPSEDVFRQLLKSMEYLRKKVPSATLTFLGEKGKYARLQLPPYIRIRKSAMYAGVAELYENFSAIVFSANYSSRENLLDAPNFLNFPGLPLVVADNLLPAPPLEDGKNCLTYPAGNALALADALELLAKKPVFSDNIAISALNGSAATWETVTARLIDLYNGAGIAKTLAEKGYENLWRQNRLPASQYRVELRDVERKATDLRLPVPLASRGAPLGTVEKKLLQMRMRELANTDSGSLRDYIRTQCAARPRSALAWCVEHGAQSLLSAGRMADAMQLVRDLVHDHKGALNIRVAAKIYYSAVDFPRAKALIRKLRKEKEFLTESEEKFCADVENCAALCAMASQRKERKFEPEARTILNPLAFSLPWSSVGYATRSHGLALAIKDMGWNILPYTRPGFPGDSKAEYLEMDFPESEKVDSLVYGRIFDFNRKQMNDAQYLYRAVEAWEKIIRERRPVLIHAASNYAVGFPALVAARRMGIPFIYEMRGFWEITRASRDSSFIHTQKYRFMTFFENLTARCADHVLTITTPMKNRLTAQGIPAEKISIAYNGVEAERFLPVEKDQELAARLGIPPDVPVIGYIGSILDYEGLDDLIRACGALAAAGENFRLLLVGDGNVLESLKTMALNNSLGEKAIFMGRVPYEEVENYYSLIDIAPFPRKPWEVCELVSPLKPMEAMAMEKAVILSGTEALREMATPETVLLFQAGEVEDLRQKLKILLNDGELRSRMGKAARRWVMANRSWKNAAKVCTEAYEGLLNE